MGDKLQIHAGTQMNPKFYAEWRKHDKLYSHVTPGKIYMLYNDRK